MGKAITHRDLDAYLRAFDAAMRLFHASKGFPPEERYSLTDQVRRSSRSVCANLAEAWRKRRYPAAFIAKLSDADAEAGETQVWIEFAVKSGYLSREEGLELYAVYDSVLATLVGMMNNPDAWTLRPRAAPAKPR